MNSKTFYYIAASVGSVIGGYIPALWGGAGVFSMWSLVLGTLGAILGIFIVYKLVN
jgi:hypothetical protein